MSVTVSFNLKKLERRLNEIEKLFLPKASEQALKQFGFESRKTLADAMRDKYQTATNYTLSSPRYKVEGQTLTVSILDDPHLTNLRPHAWSWTRWRRRITKWKLAHHYREEQGRAAQTRARPGHSPSQTAALWLSTP